MRSTEQAKEGDARATEKALLSRWGFLKLSGGGLAGLAGLMLLGAAGCGNGDDQQENQQDADQDKDRCPQRC